MGEMAEAVDCCLCSLSGLYIIYAVVFGAASLIIHQDFKDTSTQVKSKIEKMEKPSCYYTFPFSSSHNRCPTLRCVGAAEQQGYGNLIDQLQPIEGENLQSACLLPTK
jgi:hypothetical protein